MSELRYHVKKCFPMVALFVVIIFMFGLIYSPYISAGETQFKECRNCGHLNYQFSNTCSLCGESGRFEDVYLKPDCEKRDAKKKAKSLKFTKEESQKKLYDEFVLPLNNILKNILHSRDYYVDVFKGAYNEKRLEELDNAFDCIIEAREELIEFYRLQEYRSSRKHDEILYR